MKDIIKNIRETIQNVYVDDTVYFKLNKMSDFTGDYVIEDYTLENLVKTIRKELILFFTKKSFTI